MQSETCKARQLRATHEALSNVVMLLSITLLRIIADPCGSTWTLEEANPLTDKLHSYNRSVWFKTGLSLHEIGHNLGLSHAAQDGSTYGDTIGK